MKEYIIHPDPAFAARVATELRALISSAVARGRRIRVTIQDFKPRRTDRQNRFYWPAFVKVLAEWQADQDGLDACTPGYMATAHDELKDRFLRVPIINPITGEIRTDRNGNPRMRTRSSTELTTTEFNQYLDQCAAFIRDWTGADLPDPSEYHEADATKPIQQRSETAGRAA